MARTKADKGDITVVSTGVKFFSKNPVTGMFRVEAVEFLSDDTIKIVREYESNMKEDVVNRAKIFLSTEVMR